MSPDNPNMVTQAISDMNARASETEVDSGALLATIDVGNPGDGEDLQRTTGNPDEVRVEQVENKINRWKNSVKEKWNGLVAIMQSGGLQQLESVKQQMEDIVSQIEEHQASLEDNRPSATEALVKLDQALQKIIPYTDDPEYLSLGVRCCTRALALIASDDNRVGYLLNNLGNMYWMRFQQSGTPSDLDMALGRYTEAKVLFPQGSQVLCRIFLNLGNCLLNRFQCRRESSDLDQAIGYYRQALAPAPHGDSDRGSRLNALAIALYEQFQLRSEIKDLEEAISYQEEGIKWVNQQNFDIPGWLGNLGNLHHARFEYLGRLEDINKSINCIKEAISITPAGHPNMPSLLNNLGNSLQMRYDRSADVDDINKAIEAHNQAVTKTPLGHPRLPDRLITLGSSYAARYDRLGEDADRQKMLQSHHQAMLLSPSDHPDRPRHLIAIGASYTREFEFHGKISDIDGALGYFHEALALLPKEHPTMPDLFDSMASAYFKRFNRLNNREDLDKSIQLCEQAATLTVMSHTRLPRVLMNLGNSYQRRFEDQGKLEDINKAVDCHVHAIDILPTSHPNKPGLLNNLGISYLARASCSTDQEDLTNAIKFLSEASRLTVEDNTMKHIIFCSLAAAYSRRHSITGNLKDIELAIEYYSQSIILIPNDHAMMPNVLYHLGGCYQQLQNLQRSRIVQERSIECYRKSAQQPSGDASIKLRSALIWARLMTVGSQPIEEQMDAYATAMNLVPQIMISFTAVEGQYKRVQEIGDLVLGAAAVAISAKKYEIALEWLEQGRLIIWNHIVRLKNPLNDLSSVAPVLANRLRELSCQLHEASFWKPLAPRSSGESYNLEMTAQRHRRVAEEHTRVIEEARRLPGFETFLQGHKFSELVNVASSGPVVVINVDQFRCDALILLPNQKTITHIPLPNLSYHQVNRAHEHLVESLQSQNIRGRGIRIRSLHQPEHANRFASVLTTLWHSLAKPILDGLGYLSKPNATNLPHIIWCPTGSLSFLPLHAAGDYDNSAAGSRLFNHAISSYTPTLSALQTYVPKSNLSVKPKLLMVGQAQTPGQPALPGTRKELECIKNRIESPEHYTLLEGHDATPDGVLSNMQTHDWVHLACHAHQNVYNPTSSGFFLHAGTLSIFMIAQKNFKQKGLAFLSACQTARGDEKLSDEAAHLASAMLMAGYTSVIATMWSIMDSDAPLVADGVYLRLLEGQGGGCCIDAARALHKAVEGLREEIGEQAFSRWVPYVHIGQ
ncbi:unnamed protein product [Rhizoctonia solani]|uniref:CHAT domain-containing protein n=1 Tax=Rhizoctonia solani TaxID=456999 RepID=A0A8H2ZVV7_9AGAM|nr:unnamed protein product [Rhizoctonia solani]